MVLRVKMRLEIELEITGGPTGARSDPNLHASPGIYITSKCYASPFVLMRFVYCLYAFFVFLFLTLPFCDLEIFASFIPHLLSLMSYIILLLT